MPKVSVIVPNYNHVKFLKERLDSIVHQTFTDFELIILDDHSSDDSVSIISRYQTHYPNLIQFIPSTKNSGSPYIQWDKGIRYAKGELIWIAESDDFASKNFLETLVPLFEKYKHVGMIVGKSNAVNSNSEMIAPYHPVYNDFKDALFPRDSKETYFEGEHFTEEYLVERCLIPNVSGVIFQKDIYYKCGGINLQFKRSGDYDLYIRMLKHCDILFVNEQLNSTRYHSQKLTERNNRISFKERNKILLNLFNEYNLDAQRRAKIVKFYFTVFKYDIFLERKSSLGDTILTYLELSKLSPITHQLLINLLFQRLKISLSKIVSRG